MSAIRIPVPAVSFTPPVHVCRRATRPFTLDGNLDKPFWEDAQFTDLFQDIEGSHMPAPRFHTRAKILWDDEYLYFGAKLEGDEIWGHVTERDAVIFYDNDFEIFIDPDSDTQQYYEFEMNVLNTVWDLFLPIAYRDGGSALNGYDMHGLRTAVHVDGAVNDPSSNNRSWSVEVVIPFAALTECLQDKRPPKDGEYYRVNFSRVQWKMDLVNGAWQKRTNPATGNPLPEDNWVWAPTGVINIHYPELWGFVFFADSDKEDSAYIIPENERRKWELRKIYYAQQIYCDLNGVYCADEDTLKATLRQHAPNDFNTGWEVPGLLIETTSHSFELSCDAAEEGARIVLSGNGKVWIA